MDKIIIEKLTVFTIIGVYDWEQQVKQKLILDIEMAWDNKRAAASDLVEDCLNYATVSQAIIEHVSLQSFALIERVAEEIATLIFTQFSVPWVRIKVSKPAAIAQAEQVGVVIERQNPF